MEVGKCVKNVISAGNQDWITVLFAIDVTVWTIWVEMGIVLIAFLEQVFLNKKK